MRAVSLFKGVVGAGAGLGAGTDADAAAVAPIGRGKGVLAAAGGSGGGTVRGMGTLATGGADNGFCDASGLGIGTLPGSGISGADVGGGSEVGGRDGRLIKTVSSSSGAAVSPPRGGRVIRTVSFFGSFASAMVAFDR
jgi:hypothetical protein